MKLKQFGFSLMETTVALGLAGVAGYFIMQQTEIAGKSKTRGQVDEIISATSKIIQTQLSHRATCSRSLKNLGPNDEVPALEEADVDPLDFNNFIPTGKKTVKDVPLVPGVESSPRIKFMKLLAEGSDQFLEVTFDPDPLNRKKLFGGPGIKKRFQIQGNLDASNKFINCISESSNLIESATAETCVSLGGTQNPINKKCTLDFSNLVDPTPISCPTGSKVFPKTAGGKLSMGCIPCPPKRVWDHYECRKLATKGYRNLCYYKSVCEWDNSIIFSGATWDGLIGPTSASGGDTGTEGNCHSKRRKCSGEP